ncbi:hypothetical protein [Methylobacterium oxalidis]|uniref:Uncharacterized protein n=1 Tax=Methylobacterium oxalidis TaxID=944322 RepID=A0A512J3C5_9HYPH|nr:hypothetical protein [Methylobacterium oxalidis]GEP04441.1 hypothetical protein MOX02_24790 [Methylobacterium oxalidis]GJE34638.1 hypothetical protein LDDCCGHA_4850 [Methylobacterium oxalidis]GLS62813.1 hypothetical protein GCM10007888_11940 [Methylobacterium oxalidis]
MWPFSPLRHHVLFWLAKRDVGAADRALAAGDAELSARLLARADARLRRACGLAN